MGRESGEGGKRLKNPQGKGKTLDEQLTMFKYLEKADAQVYVRKVFRTVGLVFEVRIAALAPYQVMHIV